MWTLTPNCHVQIWAAAPPGVLPPVGAPTYDGIAQILPPINLTTADAIQAWTIRLIVPYSAAIVADSRLLHRPTAPYYVRFVNDTGPTQVGWWAAYDLSPSTRPDPATPGNYLIDVLFLALSSV
jgi:hypothetical protein